MTELTLPLFLVADELPQRMLHPATASTPLEPLTVAGLRFYPITRIAEWLAQRNMEPSDLIPDGALGETFIHSNHRTITGDSLDFMYSLPQASLLTQAAGRLETRSSDVAAYVAWHSGMSQGIILSDGVVCTGTLDQLPPAAQPWMIPPPRDIRD
ncbi:hypothetical protein [Microbacterium sp. GXS0129]|uniref:hypothetical protein n=1 Tax=Microbacterium sp. GXS0129 TaxID=3377836 RepID=UPI003839DDD2